MSPEEKKITQDRFSNELWPLNRVGNPQLAISEVIHSLEDDMLFTGGQVTFDVILKKYKEHLLYIKNTNIGRDIEYHKKVDDISTFVIKKRYNEDFIPASITEIDKYLYGS